MSYYVDVQVKTWQRVYLDEDTLPIEDAIKLCKQFKVDQLFELCDRWENLVDSEKYMRPSDDKGRATIEIYDNKDKLIFDNHENT